MIRAILGIGNPGLKYADTRHNIGFIVLDRFCAVHKLRFRKSDNDYHFAEGELNNSPFFLIKPMTYVNLSGVAAYNFCSAEGISPENLLVVCDDVYLESGIIRIRKKGGDGGHNGLASIIYSLQSDQFPRIRFGIGDTNENIDLKIHVLSKFDESEINELSPSFDFTLDLMEKFISGGIKEMLDFFSKTANRPKKDLI